jgi:hypothetical protein
LPMDREIERDQIRPPKEAAARLLPASPPSVEVLRAKLDAAIVAEAWEAAPVIRRRIVEAELEAKGTSATLAKPGANVVQLDTRRGSRRPT